MFTQQHYIAVAATLESIKPDSLDALPYWKETVEAFVRMFACDNHKFKESMFVDACDYQYEEEEDEI